MIDLKHVRTFLSIHWQGSFSGAAELLDIAQPTVSLHIKTLEQALGYSLFDRIGKSVIMTPDGHRFLSLAKQMVRLADEAQSIAHPGRPISGKITLCIVQSIAIYKMPAILREFRRAFPTIQVNVTVNRPSTYMLEQLRNREFDASIVLEAPFEIPQLQSRPLWTDQLTLVASHSHNLVQKSSIKYQMLKNEVFVFPEAGAHYRRLFERRLLEHDVIPNVGFEIDNIEAIKKLVASGAGLAILPRFAIEAELANGQLMALPLEGRKLGVTAQLIWHKEKPMSDAAKAFIDLMVISQ